MKSVQIQSHSFLYGEIPAFELNTERYFISLCIQSKYWKIRTRKNSVFGHASHSSCSSDCSEKFPLNVNKELIRLNINLLKDSEPFVELLFWAAAFVSTSFLFVNSFYLLICYLFISYVILYKADLDSDQTWIIKKHTLDKKKEDPILNFTGLVTNSFVINSESADFKYDNSFFQTPAQKIPKSGKFGHKFKYFLHKTFHFYKFEGC